MSSRTRPAFATASGVKLGKYGTARKFKNDLRSAARAAGRASAPVIEKAVVRAETKLAMKNAGYVDQVLGPTTIGTGVPLVLVGTVPMGSGNTQRVGNKIKWKSVQIRGTVFTGASNTGPVKSSMMLIYDRFPPDSVPSITTVLVTDNCNSMLNDENRNRFVILRRWDWIGASSQQNMPNAGYYNVDEYVKLKGLPCDYKGGSTGSGGFGDIRVGALYLAFTGDANVVPLHQPSITGNIRVRFADIIG